MTPLPSKTIDPTKTHGTPLTSPYFISLHVRTCEPNAENIISNAIRETIERCSIPGSKSRKAALQRHTNPFWSLYGMMFSMSEPDRVGIVVKFLEFLYIMDDAMDELPYEQSIQEHDILCQALTSCYESVALVHNGNFNGRGVRTSEFLKGMVKFLIDLRKSVLALGVEQGSILLTDLKRSLQQRQRVPAAFATLEEYLPYRVMHLDWDFVCILLRWSMNIPLDLTSSFPSSSSALANFEYLTGVTVALCNDYHSWNPSTEKAHHHSNSLKSDHRMNAVPVLMKQYFLPEVWAKKSLRNLIVDAADKMLEARKGLEKVEGTWNGYEDKKGSLERYVEALEYLAGGYAYWCSTCPTSGKTSIANLAQIYQNRPKHANSHK